MTERRVPVEDYGDSSGSDHTLRIGEVAKLCGVTTRTLRYWEEIGLVAPSEQRHGSERVYADSEVERARRIRELQALMGFSLAEIRVVLETEDTVDRLRDAYKVKARPELRRKLLANAIDANDALVARLDDTLARVKDFRDERVAKATRLRARAAELDDEIASVANVAAGKPNGTRVHKPDGKRR